MVSGFKVYSKRGMGVLLSVKELALIHAARVSISYTNRKPMLPLKESPCIRIMDPTKAGDGYWNCEKW